jgi:hypothetical protein
MSCFSKFPVKDRGGMFLTWIFIIAIIISMNSKYSEIDKYLRTMGQVEPEPNEPEKPGGGDK